MSDKHIIMYGIFGPKAFVQLRKDGIKKIFVLESRPKLDSSQLTCKKLIADKIKPVIVSDNMAGFLFARNMVKEVWLSYQLIDEKGAVCRIGGLILAVLSKKHKVPVYLFKSEKRIKYMGKPEDLFYFQGKRIAPRGIKGYVPLVEWVPEKYITQRYE